ncbi:uncharacterized protein WCC33_013116 [Rhinophrynus dorsalis]
MIKNIQLEKCIHVTHDSGRVSLAECKVHSHHQWWIWDPDTSSIRNVKSNGCLTVRKIQEFSSLRMEACDNSDHQTWSCDLMGHLTLRGHDGLYLSAKHGSKKVFVSKGKDKLSKWKTGIDASICKGAVKPTVSIPGKKEQILENVTQVLYEVKFKSTTEKARSFSTRPVIAETSPATRLPAPTSTSNTTANTLLSATRSHNEHGEHFEKIDEAFIKTQYLSAQTGNGWTKTMLILSPLAFILGMIVLALNIHTNKKRKLLSALPSHPKSIHKLGSAYEQCPLTEKGDGSGCTGPDPHSPTMRHGEILIEWKDGTVTPLYDHQSN